jgi:hypothetical protein
MLDHERQTRRSDRAAKCLILLVPGERIELPTNGLQNRCSTAELTRLVARLSISEYPNTICYPLTIRARITP